MLRCKILDVYYIECDNYGCKNSKSSYKSCTIFIISNKVSITSLFMYATNVFIGCNFGCRCCIY